jgi:alpha-ketoglutarate-dependent taurine dioxygenase
MARLTNNAVLLDAIKTGRLVERDGKPVTVSRVRRAASKGQPEALIRMEIMKPAEAYLHPDKLVLWVADQGRTILPFYYLRDLCKCPKCVDPHSKQRSFRTSDIPKDVYPRLVRWDGTHLEVTWANDIAGYGKDHTSRWNIKYLKNPILDPHEQTSPNMKPLRWTSNLMSRLQHWVSYEDYMKDDAKFAAAMRNLSRLGLIFVKDIPDSREMVAKIATRMGPLRNTFYGETWDVKTVPQAKNVAYTNQFLGFHMDLMYMNEPPGYQLLHCLENSCDGGESLFADTFRAANIMKSELPTEYKALSRRHLGYEYAHDEHKYHNTRPVFQLDPKTNELRYVNYSPPFQSALPEYEGKAGSGTVGYVDLKRALTHFIKIMEGQHSVFQLKLNPGECVIFNNRRIVHARNKFNTSSGSRWLAGAYVDEDALLSRYAVCRENEAITWKAADPFVGLEGVRREIAETSAYDAQLALAEVRLREGQKFVREAGPLGEVGKALEGQDREPEPIEQSKVSELGNPTL